MRALLAALAVLTAVAPPLAAARQQAFTLPSGGALVLELPDDWTQDVGSDEEGSALKLGPSSGERFSLQLSPFPIAGPLDRAVLRERLRGTVGSIAGEIARRAVERSLPLQPIGGEKEGFWFTATDRDPGPGEFARLAQGALAVGDDLGLFFTLLFDGARSPIPARAIEVLRTARFDRSSGPRKVSSLELEGALYRIALPEGRGTLAFPAGGLAVEARDDVRPYYFLVDRGSGLNVSFNFEPAGECTTSESCRDLFTNRLKELNAGWRDWRHDRVGDVFLSEATDPGVEGVPIRQRHVNAHLVVNGVWIDVHLSRVGFETQDRRLFLDFIRSVRTGPAR